MDKKNIKRLTPNEITEQIASIIEQLQFKTNVGCYDNSVYLGKDTNPIKFSNVNLNSSLKKNILADLIRDTIIHGKTEIDTSKI